MNGAVAATTVADQYLLFRTFLEHGGTCKLALLCISPRELHDNFHPIPEKTQVYERLGDPFSMRALQQRGFEGCLSMAWQQMNPLFATRIQIQRAATSIGNQLAKTKTEEPQAPSFVKPKNDLRDIQMWKNTYNPVNWKLYDTQISYLERFLKLAKEKSIPVIVVDMPLPRQNIGLLDPALKQRVASDTQRLASQYGAQLVHPGQEQTYTLADFEDGGHMVATGGCKLFDKLTDYISASPALHDRLASTPSTIK
jgi:hypothetical protein